MGRIVRIGENDKGSEDEKGWGRIGAHEEGLGS